MVRRIISTYIQARSKLTERVAPEELSEEDQQLKNELDMLVERLTVRSPTILWMAKSLTQTVSGARLFSLQACPGGNEEFHQDIYLLNDSQQTDFVGRRRGDMAGSRAGRSGRQGPDITGRAKGRKGRQAGRARPMTRTTAIP